MENKPMIQFETAQGKYLAVEVYSDAHSFDITGSLLSYMRDTTIWTEWLPKGGSYTYSIVGIADRLDVVQKLHIVYEDKPVYRCFENAAIVYDIPDDSFASLLRSHNIPSSALIIKIEG